MNKKVTFAIFFLALFGSIAFAREEIVTEFLGKVPSFEKANRVFQKSCVQCHSAEASLPWYAHAPGIKSKMKQEYRASLSAFNLDSEECAYQGRDACAE